MPVSSYAASFPIYSLLAADRISAVNNNPVSLISAVNNNPVSLILKIYMK